MFAILGWKVLSQLLRVPVGDVVGGPYKSVAVLASVRRVTGQFSWLAVYYFRCREITKPL